MTALDQLAAGKYVLLTTFRKDGRAVPTPVWVARDGDALVAWTVKDAGKVKRIRRSGAVTMAPCDATETARIRGLLARRYGLLGRLAMLGSRVRRGADGTVGIRVTVEG